MWDLRPNEDKISVIVEGDIVPNKALSPAIERERQLVFRVVVPFKRNSLQPAIEQHPGCVFGRRDVFKVGLHRGGRYGSFVAPESL